MAHKGLTHVYYGSGKGKTTAALGLALRASGCAKNVVIIQFLKDGNSGELTCLQSIDNITVLRGKAKGAMFVRDMTDEQKAETKRIHDDNLLKALSLQSTGECDMLILDEAIDALNLELLDRALFFGLLKDKPDDLELVITGHNPTGDVLEYADYVTEMVKHKHPYDAGISARRGIEF